MNHKRIAWPESLIKWNDQISDQLIKVGAFKASLRISLVYCLQDVPVSSEIIKVVSVLSEEDVLNDAEAAINRNLFTGKKRSPKLSLTQMINAPICGVSDSFGATDIHQYISDNINIGKTHFQTSQEENHLEGIRTAYAILTDVFVVIRALAIVSTKKSLN